MFGVSIGLTIAAIIIVAVFGLRLGVDFKGGSVLELQFLDKMPVQEEIKSVLISFDYISNVSIQLAEGNTAIIRFKEINEGQHQEVLGKIKSQFGKIEEKRFNSAGPVVGQELKRKSVSALTLLFVAIVVYISFAFRRLSSVLSPWAMGGAALVALVHDVAIPAGVFAVLGRYYSVEINAVFLAAALTILGYSVSDSVVVFDRIRENVLRFGKDNFNSLVHKSVLQTLSRSINTSVTTLLSLFAIYFFGGESVRMFSLALILGIFLGAYSSIFVASPIVAFMSRK